MAETHLRKICISFHDLANSQGFLIPIYQENSALECATYQQIKVALNRDSKARISTAHSSALAAHSYLLPVERAIQLLYPPDESQMHTWCLIEHTQCKPYPCTRILYKPWNSIASE